MTGTFPRQYGSPEQSRFTIHYREGHLDNRSYQLKVPVWSLLPYQHCEFFRIFRLYPWLHHPNARQGSHGITQNDTETNGELDTIPTPDGHLEKTKGAILCDGFFQSKRPAPFGSLANVGLEEIWSGTTCWTGCPTAPSSGPGTAAVTNRDPVKIGVVGLGRFGRLHALTVSKLTECRLVGLVARRSESLARLESELPGTPGWTDLDAALDESGAEAWVVACSTYDHVRVASRILQCGHPVLLEKPVAETLDEARRLSPLVRSDSSNLMLGHIVLFNSEFQELREQAARRGSISLIDCVRHRPASIVHQFPGENPLVATMVHDLYLVPALIGGVEPTAFSAQYHRTAEGAIDAALAQLAWAHGPVASLKASYLTPVGMPPRGFDRMEIFGSGWAARIEPNPRPLTVWDAQASWPLALEIRAGSGGVTGMLAEELRCFCRVVRGQEPVPAGATYHHALQVQAWIERLHAVADAASGAT